MTRIGSVILIFIMLNIVVYASDEIVTAVLSESEIYIDETITLSIIINGSSASTNPPEIENLTHVATSQEKEFNYSGGIKSTKTIYSYTYRAEEVGSYQIDSIPVRINGETYDTKPLFFDVKDRQAAPSQNSNAGNSLVNSILSFMDEDNDTIENSIFLHSDLTKTNVYVYEPIYLEQSIYIRHNLDAEVVGIAHVGDKNNFWIKDDNNEYITRAEILNDKAYFVHLLNREVLLPILPGEQSITENTYIFDVASKSLSFNDRVEKGGETLTINVLPLPTKNKPKDFSGAVGDFNFELLFNTDSVKVGETFLLSLIVWGEGSTDVVKLPDVSKVLLEKYKDFGLEIYSPKQYLTNEISNGKMHSEKIIEYMMVVNNNSVKKIVIDPQHFSFFSTKLARYTTLETKKISLSISSSGISGNNANNNRANNQIASTTTTENITDKNIIMPIKTGVIKISSSDMFIFSDKFLFIYLSISIFIIFIVYLAKKIIIPYFLNKKEQERKLSFDNANQYLIKGDIKNYIKEIEAVFYKNISNVLSKDVSSKSSMESALKASNIDIEVQSKAIKIIEQCNYILYTPREDKSIRNYNFHHEMKSIIDRLSRTL